MWTILDETVGCGVNRRPDGLMVLNGVKFILENDEDQHQGNTPECEISRLYEIRDRDKDALYVLRYNPGALEEEGLNVLAERILKIIEEDYKKALESSNLIHIEYIGYGKKRVDILSQTEMKMQADTLANCSKNGKDEIEQPTE
jgi:hypothetical protein